MQPEVVRVGSGRRLLLLHSGFCTWVEFRRLIDLLATDHEVIAPTLPGSVGGALLDVRASMLAEHARYVESVLDELDWNEPVDVVGSSFGGVLALELLARGRAQSAIALAPPWTTGTGLAFYGALLAGLPALGLSRPLWSRTTRSGTINGLWFHQSRTPPLIDPADVALLLESWSRFPFYRVGSARSPPRPGDARLLTRSTRRARSLVWGGRDFIVPAVDAEAVVGCASGVAGARRCPGSLISRTFGTRRSIADLIRVGV